MEKATERTSATRMHICEVCNKSFTRKDNLSQHLSVHVEKRFQCSHCSKCYSRGKKLKVHIFRHHTNDNKKSSKKSLACTHCSKVVGRSFNFRRHIAVCKKKSVEANKSDTEAIMLEMTSAEREYRQKLEVGETVSTLLHANEHLSEESLMEKYKKALKLYRQSQVQRVPVYEQATLKPWQKDVLAFIQQPSHREVIWVVGQQGGEGKTFLQNYIKYHYSNRRVITTEIATSTKDIAHYLSKFPLECKDIFLFNHPCSTTDVVACDLLEGIKDGYKISAKYDTRGLVFKTPNTVITFSNNFPNTEALKKDRWKVYEIIGEELCDKTLWSTKPKLHVIKAHKNYTIYDDWCCENMRNGVDRQFGMNQIIFIMKWIFFLFWEIYIWQLWCIAFVDWGKLFQSSLWVGLLCRVYLAGNS